MNFKKFNNLLAFVICISITSCKQKQASYFDHFSRNNEGLYYKILKLGDGDYKIGIWDEVNFSCNFKTNKDSIFFSSQHERVFLNANDSLRKSHFISHFLNLVEGDSVAYYIKTPLLFESYFQTEVPPYCSKDSLTKIEVLIKDIKKEVKVSESELKKIRDYIQRKKYTNVIELPNKIFILERRVGSGSDNVARGKTISLSYKGRFLNDSLFDQPFYPMQFVYGTPDQILKGLNFVIKGMNQGEFVKIILPSYLAYGENGNTNATVPPNTPLLYELTITDIKK